MTRNSFEHRMIRGLILLLFLEASVLGLHFAWGGFRPRPQEQQAQIAGEVARSENQILRRGVNSLVWEKSGVNQPLYFYDSVLTLAQSTASLRLFRDTELQLSENTLVTIEPQDKSASGEIRLKFHRGGLKARNPFSSTRVDGEAWSMNIKSGSEVDLRQVDDGKFELNVSKGEVAFQSPNGEQKVSSDEVLRIDLQSASKLQKLNAQWTDTPPKRIYTFGNIAPLNLKWKGEGATQLLMQKVRETETVVPLVAEDNQTTVAVAEGQYRFFLRNGDKTSDALDVEVWPAPIIHLVYPLPRNRIQTNSLTNFIWTRPPGIEKFHFQIKGQKVNQAQDGTDNSFATKFDVEDDTEWIVLGEDAHGFPIPSLYSAPLFIREQPLAAPKLKAPTIRQPASKDKRGASFWFRLQELILPQAQAAEELSYEAVFAWEPVDRADHYVIEISETADFRTLLVTQKVVKSEFIWKKALLKPVYWRVAAGTAQRLGYFSEPQLSDLSSENSGVEIRASTPPVPKPVAKPPPPVIVAAEATPVSKVEAPPPIAEKIPTPIPVEEYTEGARFEWRPAYINIQTKASESVKAELHGQTMMAIAARFVKAWGENRAVHIHLEYSQTDFEPDPKKKFPFQENINWSDYRVHSVFFKKTSRYGWGLFARKSTALERTGLEKLSAKDVLLLGGSFNGLWRWRRLQYVGNLQVMSGTQSGAATAHTLRLPLGKILFGIGGEAETLFQGSETRTSVTANASIGFDF